MRAYGELSSAMKASVWTHQLLTALAEHPEFTEEQRSVLYDAIDLFSPELFNISQESPDWSARVDQPVRGIEQRAKAAFGATGAWRLLAQLGPYTPGKPRDCSRCHDE